MDTLYNFPNTGCLCDTLDNDFTDQRSVVSEVGATPTKRMSIPIRKKKI